MQNPVNEKIKEILEQAKTIAVVGLSGNPTRTSYQVSQAMQNVGYRIIPVNPGVEEVLGEKAYATLAEVPDEIDIINVFRRPEHLIDVAKDALLTDCKVFWAQQGIVNEEAAELLANNGSIVIMDLCIKVAHAVLVRN